MDRGADEGPVPATRLAVPDAGHGPGVLVLGAGPREEALVDEACRRLARHGFVALGVVPPADAPAEPAPSAAERERTDAALEALARAHPTDGARFGAIGFGRAGALVVDAAARGARLAALVSFGGAEPIAALEAASLARVEAALLVLVGEKDPGAAAGRSETLEARLAGLRGELRVLPGAHPDFFDPLCADRYDAVAARAAWDAATARLRAEL